LLPEDRDTFAVNAENAEVLVSESLRLGTLRAFAAPPIGEPMGAVADFIPGKGNGGGRASFLAWSGRRDQTGCLFKKR